MVTIPSSPSQRASLATRSAPDWLLPTLANFTALRAPSWWRCHAAELPYSVARAKQAHGRLPRDGRGPLLQRHALPRPARVAIKLAAQLPGSLTSALRVAPQADSGWPYSERWDSNPNSKPCTVTLVSPTAQAYRVGAGGSGLEVLPSALCQYVSIRGPPRNEGTHSGTAATAGSTHTIQIKPHIRAATIATTF